MAEKTSTSIRVDPEVKAEALLDQNVDILTHL